MRNKKISTGSLIALGLSIHSLYVTAQEAEEISKHTQHTHQHSENKSMEAGCGGQMRMDINGMVMYENKTTLPKDCKEISEDITIDVNAGVKYSKPYAGSVFGFNEHQWQAKPCSRITVNFTNDDEIRHQWMIHGLPKYLYPQGMFHIEANGGQSKTGTFIVPNSHYTYLVHCDIAQHTEKGMKAQLKIGNGRGDLSSIVGISPPKFTGKF